MLGGFAVPGVLAHWLKGGDLWLKKAVNIAEGGSIPRWR
jgi:hypothetical protein